MELLLSLIKLLSAAEKELLLKKYSRSNNLHERLLVLLLSSPAAEKELIKALKTTTNTFHKTCTLSKELLIRHISSTVAGPFGEISIVREMSDRMDTSAAMKYLNYLEKKLELTQDWQAMELLYIEGFRLQHITGNIRKVKEIAAKRKKNATRLLAFIELSIAINTQMLLLESYTTRKAATSYLPELVQLGKHSEKLGHAALIHNTLNLQYLYYSRYTAMPSKVAEIAKRIFKNAQENKARLSGTRYYLAMNTYVVFLTIYNDFGKPNEYANALRKKIKSEGTIALVNLCYAMAEYCLYTFDKKGAADWLNELELAEDRSKFSQYKYGLMAIRAFSEKDDTAFRKQFRNFYKDPSYSSFPDLETTLRILELLQLMKEKSYLVAESKINSLRVYIDRNLDPKRYADERTLVRALCVFLKHHSPEKTQAVLYTIRSSPYRNIRFLTTMFSQFLLHDK